jgi:hypothetical protein
MGSLGFIILRHVTSEVTNTYWKIAYASIRKFYRDNPILIIDDNSDQSFIREEDENLMHNVTVLRSEFPQRGELLPYYYFLKHKPFDTACILHDSAFLNSPIDGNVDKYKILWSFEHHWDCPDEEKPMLRVLKNSDELIEFYDQKDAWKGCFGGMSIITHEYLAFVDARYDIARLIDPITTRTGRSLFERVIACILQRNHRSDALLGDIHRYCPWGITIDQKEAYRHLPIIKIWTGR